MLNNSIMKVLAVVLLLAVASSNARQLSGQETTAYGYLANIGVPEADRIRNKEENQSTNVARVVGGLGSMQGQFPFQAGLIIDLVGFEGNAVCGGAMLSPNKVSTAAHCWYDGVNQAWRFTVVLGSDYLFKDVVGSKKVETSAVFTHPSWFPLLARNDVAIIYLPEPVELTSYINPIALPYGDLLNEKFDGEAGIVVGFGAKGNGVAISEGQDLNHATVKIISNSECKLTYPLHVTDSNICSVGYADNASACGGDSGSALYVRRDHQVAMVGIVSFTSDKGCDLGFPAVYARTTEYMSFFNQHLQ